MPENCADINGLLSGYIDGELSAEETALVEKHLASCENCGKELKRLNNIIELLRNIPRYQASTRLLSEVREEIKKRQTFWDLSSPFLKWGAGLAAAALVFFFLKSGAAVPAPQKTIPPSNEISFPWDIAKKSQAGQAPRPQAGVDEHGGGRTEPFESVLSDKAAAVGLIDQNSRVSQGQTYSAAYGGETEVLRAFHPKKSFIIRSVDEWNDFYSLVFPGKEMPYVDFSTRMVIGVCGPGLMRIAAARAAKESFLVSYRSETKNSDRGDISCCLKVIEKTDMEVIFTRE